MFSVIRSMPTLCQHLKSDKTDISQSGNSLKSQNTECTFFFLPLGRKLRDGMFSSGTVLCWLGEEVDMGKVKFLFLLFQCNYSQLCTHLGVLKPLNWILETS